MSKQAKPVKPVNPWSGLMAQAQKAKDAAIVQERQREVKTRWVKLSKGK